MAAVFGRFFGKPKVQTDTLSTLAKLNETLEMLEKKEGVLKKKAEAEAEVEEAKEFTRAKNKRAAKRCKRRRLYDQEAEQFGNWQLKIYDQDDNARGCKSYNRNC